MEEILSVCHFFATRGLTSKLQDNTLQFVLYLVPIILGHIISVMKIHMKYKNLKKLSMKVYSWVCTPRPQIGKWWENQHQSHSAHYQCLLPDLQISDVNSHDSNFLSPKWASLPGFSCRQRYWWCSGDGWVTSFPFPLGSAEVRDADIHQLRRCPRGMWDLLPLQKKPFSQVSKFPSP